jgi:hypothetical protein
MLPLSITRELLTTRIPDGGSHRRAQTPACRWDVRKVLVGWSMLRRGIQNSAMHTSVREMGMLTIRFLSLIILSLNILSRNFSTKYW